MMVQIGVGPRRSWEGTAGMLSIAYFIIAAAYVMTSS